MQYKNLSAEDILNIKEQTVKDDEKFRKLVDCVKIIAKDLPGTDAYKKSLAPVIKSYIFRFGNPHWWITINLADIHSPILSYFINPNSNLIYNNFEKLVPENLRNIDERIADVAGRPVEVAQYYQYTIDNILLHLIGYNKTTHKTTQGLFGTPLALFWSNRESISFITSPSSHLMDRSILNV